MNTVELRQFCTFTLDGHHFGVDVSKVQELIRFQEMTAVPLANPVVAGLINLRGQIVTALDLRRRIGLPDRAPGAQPMNVVIRTAEGPVSFLVDDIGDVVEVGDDTFERPPETLQGAARDLIPGAHKLEGRLLLVLDADRTASLRDSSTDGRTT
jgi:purine-binding chemotaxis protein CheW